MKKFLNKKAIKYYLKTFFNTNKALFIFSIIVSIFRIAPVIFISIKNSNSSFLESNSSLSFYDKISNLFLWNHFGIDYKLGIQNFIDSNAYLISNFGEEDDKIKNIIWTFLSLISCTDFTSMFHLVPFYIFGILKEFFEKIYREDFLGWNSPQNDDKFVILNTNWTREEIFFSKFISIFLISFLISLYGSLFVAFNKSKLSINIFQSFLYVFLNTFIFNIFSSINEKVITYLSSWNQMILFLVKMLFLFLPNLTNFILIYLKLKGFLLNLEFHSFFLIIKFLIFSLEVFIFSMYYNKYKNIDFKI